MEVLIEKPNTDIDDYTTFTLIDNGKFIGKATFEELNIGGICNVFDSDDLEKIYEITDEDQVYYINAITVDVNNRGKGYGTLLLSTIVEYVSNLNKCTNTNNIIMLLADSLDPSVPTRYLKQFYYKNGFLDVFEKEDQLMYFKLE